MYKYYQAQNTTRHQLSQLVDFFEIKAIALLENKGVDRPSQTEIDTVTQQLTAYKSSPSTYILQQGAIAC